MISSRILYIYFISWGRTWWWRVSRIWYHLVSYLYTVYLEAELDGEEVVGYDMIWYRILSVYSVSWGRTRWRRGSRIWYHLVSYLYTLYLKEELDGEEVVGYDQPQGGAHHAHGQLLSVCPGVLVQVPRKGKMTLEDPVTNVNQNRVHTCDNTTSVHISKQSAV